MKYKPKRELVLRWEKQKKERESLPKDFPTIGDVWAKVAFELFDDHIDWNDPKTFEAISTEVEAVWAGIVRFFGKPQGLPFITRELNILSGRWVAKNPGAKRGKKKEVNQFLVLFHEKIGDDQYQKYSSEMLAEAFHKETGMTTTRQVVSASPFHKRIKMEASMEKESRARRMRKT